MQKGRKNKKGKLRGLERLKKPKYAQGTSDIGVINQSQLGLNNSTSGGTTNSGGMDMGGLWGALAGFGTDISNNIKGDSLNESKTQLGTLFDPENQFKNNETTEDWAVSFLNPFGSALDKGRRETEEAKRQKFLQGRASGLKNLTLAHQNAGNQFKHGGRILAKKLNVVGGGVLNAISDDAVEVKANNPNFSDSVELNSAFVDHNEVIDRKNRVYSDSVFLPNGKSVAKEAKKLEKMKAEDYEKRFASANKYIDSKLDELFSYQESSKQKLSHGGVKTPYEEGGEIEMTRGEFMKEHRHLLKVLESGSKEEREEEYEDQEREMKKYLKSGGKIHIKPENRGKFTAYKKRTGKTIEEALRSKDPHVRKMANFARNAKKWKHEDGGTIKMPYQTGGNLPNPPKKVDLRPPGLKEYREKKQKEFDAFYEESMTNIEKANKQFGSGSKQHKAAIDNYINSKPKSKHKWGDYINEDTLSSGASTAATYLPNLFTASTINKLKGPATPSLEQTVRLKRLSPDAQLAAAAQQTRQAQGVINKNTAQGSDLASATGMLLAKRLNAQNQIYGDINAGNAQIQGQEAQINQGTKARNAERITNYKQSQVDFENMKKRLKTENVANLSTKVQQQGREYNQMQLDKDKAIITAAQFGDSKVLQRLGEQLQLSDPKTYERLKKQGYFKFGGYLSKKLNKKK